MCKICDNKNWNATVRIFNNRTDKVDFSQNDEYLFSTDPAIGAMFCPLCGKPMNEIAKAGQRTTVLLDIGTELGCDMSIDTYHVLVNNMESKVATYQTPLIEHSKVFDAMDRTRELYHKFLEEIGLQQISKEELNAVYGSKIYEHVKVRPMTEDEKQMLAHQEINRTYGCMAVKPENVKLSKEFTTDERVKLFNSRLISESKIDLTEAVNTVVKGFKEWGEELNESLIKIAKAMEENKNE